MKIVVAEIVGFIVSRTVQVAVLLRLAPNPWVRCGKIVPGLRIAVNAMGKTGTMHVMGGIGCDMAGASWLCHGLKPPFLEWTPAKQHPHRPLRGEQGGRRGDSVKLALPVGSRRDPCALINRLRWTHRPDPGSLRIGNRIKEGAAITLNGYGVQSRTFSCVNEFALGTNAGVKPFLLEAIYVRGGNKLLFRNHVIEYDWRVQEKKVRRSRKPFHNAEVTKGLGGNRKVCHLLD